MAQIVHISPSRIPGHAANSFQVMKMAQALCALTPNMMLVAQRGSGTPSDEMMLQTYFGIDRVPPLRLLGGNGRFGIHLFNFRAALIARRLGAELVLSRSIGAAAFAARLGIPTVWECHAPPQGLEGRYFSALCRAAAFRRLVVISKSLSGIMTERHPEAAAHDIVVAHDGVDSARFEGLPSPCDAKRSASRDPARPIAAYAGHLYDGRGIDIILACAAALPHWTFIVAGGLEADIARVERKSRESGINNVELLGFINNAALPSRLAMADVLLMPYQKSVMVSGGTLDTAQWMSPLKMFEYMAMGRAIVSSDLPVLREVLDESVARLVPPDRPQSWVEALTDMANPERRRPIAEAAKRRAIRYDWSARAARILEGLIETGAASSSSVRLSD